MTANDRLKEIRNAKNLSQAKFGEIIGLSQTKIRDIEIGRQRVTPEIAKKVEEIFNVSLRWLLFEEGEMFLQDQTINSLQDLKNKYNLSAKDLELIVELLNFPEKRKNLIEFMNL